MPHRRVLPGAECIEDRAGGGRAADEAGALVERARGGDRAAFAALVAEQLRLHLPRRLQVERPTASEAEDIAQEVCVKLATGDPRIRRPFAAFNSWLYRVTLNVVRDHAARRADDGGVKDRWRWR